MSVSGYVSEGYQLAITSPEKEALQLPYSAVVTDMSISRAYDHIWTEIKVPCLLQNQVYEIAFTLNTSQMQEYLPKIDPDTVKLLCYKKRLATQEETPKHETIIKKPKFRAVVLSKNTLKATFRFAVSSQFRTTKKNSCLQLALQIDDVIIKHLVCDIAVFTNSKQITREYLLALGPQTQKKLESAFWASKERFCAVIPQKRKKEISGSSEMSKALSEEEEEEEEVSSVSNELHLSSEVPKSFKKQLDTLIETAQENLVTLKKFAQGKLPYYEDDVSQIALSISSACTPLIKTQNMPTPADAPFAFGMIFDSPFFDVLNAPSWHAMQDPYALKF